jgi:hypothetical protein
MDQVAGLAELMVGSTLLGIVANALGAVAEGRDPFRPGASILRRRSLRAFAAATPARSTTISCSASSRARSRVARPAPGASPGRPGELWDRYVDATHPAVGRGGEGSKIAPPGLLMARDDQPCGNMWWTRRGADYLICRQFAEWMNPGCFHRMHRQ